MSDPTSTPESVPEPRWKCRADHFVYGYCDGPVGARPGHNSCGWSDPPAASSPDEGGEATICRRCGGLGPDHQTWCSVRTFAGDPPASADEGVRQRTGGWSLVRDEEPVQASRPWSLYRPDGRRYGTLTDEEAAALQRSHLAAPPAPSTPATQPETVCDCCGAHRVIGWAGVCEPCWTYINAMPLPATPPSTPAEPEQADG